MKGEGVCKTRNLLDLPGEMKLRARRWQNIGRHDAVSMMLRG